MLLYSPSVITFFFLREYHQRQHNIEHAEDQQNLEHERKEVYLLNQKI